MNMKLKYNLTSLIIASCFATLTSCSGNSKKGHNANQQQIEQQVNPNQAKIAELEAQLDAVQNQIEVWGHEYEAAHPELSIDALVDSLNELTPKSRLGQQREALRQQIDSLKAL